MRTNLILAGCFFIIVASCTPRSTAPVLHDAPHPGMVKVGSAGKSFQQGWNDPAATTDEQPGMASSFTYDYWLDTVEVTQGHFAALMGRNPVPDTSSTGVGENLPVYQVTWLDAALFCNARSKAESLDTVYSYSGKSVQPDGSVSSLVGLRCDLTRDGYRLPTEAEWEFAARGGSPSLPYSSRADSGLAQADAWYTADASGRVHPVASKMRNQLGLYDMAGNVFEWTNDWKTEYTGTPMVNSAGALQPNGCFEKVIKGGAYNYGFDYLRPSHRSATYRMDFSTACSYVGFRCARGAIGTPRYIGAALQDTVLNPVNLLMGGRSFLAATGGVAAKLVWVNVTGQNRTLMAVNFAGNAQFPVEYVDDRSVYLPAISPDGRYVAYCSRGVGLSGRATITIRSLDSLKSPKIALAADSAYGPRWWVDPSNGDTDLIYANSSEVNQQADWNTARTFLQRVAGGRPVGSPRVLIADGGYCNGLSVDGRYALSSYTALLARDLTTGRQSQLFVSPHNGKPGDGSSQACNGSMSPDGGDCPRCLFLDFGSPVKSTVTGCSYGIHQYLFVASMADSITGFLRAPANEDSWDYPQWSNQAQFAVACGATAAGQSHAIYLVDLSWRTSTPVLSGVEIEQPSLWINRPAVSGGFCLDSLGQYNLPAGLNESEATIKLLRFWQLYDSIDVIGLGSSQMMHGFAASELTGYRAYNMGTDAGDFPLQKLLIYHYILAHRSRLQLIVSSLDAVWLNDTVGQPQIRVGLNFPQTVGYRYDESHGFWPTPDPGFIKLLGQIPAPANWFKADGSQECAGGGWGVTPAITDSCAWSVTDPLCQINLADFAKLADTLRSKGIHWLVVNFPADPVFKNTPLCGPYGPSWKTQNDLMAKLQALADTNPFFHLYDANMGGDNDYGDTDACRDGYFNHLSPTGAKKLTRRLDSIIHLILQ